MILIDKEYKINKLENMVKERDEKLLEIMSKKPEFAKKEFDNILTENRILRENIDKVTNFINYTSYMYRLKNHWITYIWLKKMKALYYLN